MIERTDFPQRQLRPDSQAGRAKKSFAEEKSSDREAEQQSHASQGEEELGKEDWDTEALIRQAAITEFLRLR